MRVGKHIIASGLIGGIWYYLFKSIPEAFVCFLSGFLLDADHFIDYYLNHPFTVEFQKIHKACREIDLKKVYVVLHSYELVILMFLLGYMLPVGRVWFAATLGVTQHIMFDQFANPVRPFTYFLTYRISRGFDIKAFLRDEKK